jgi:hypothetical protein
VVIVWFYVLRLGPGAITGVASASSSPDGGAAIVAANVDRGGKDFVPRFRVDLSTGDVRRLDRGALNAAKEMPGIWHSRDGGTQVWTDQTPMLLRNARQLLQRRLSPFHFQSRFGAEQTLALPDDFVPDFDWELRLPVLDILPTNSGDMFAIDWFDRVGRHFAFMSPAHGQLSVVHLTGKRVARRAWMFLPSGVLRVAFQRRVEKVEEIEFVDIEPANGKVTSVASAPIGRFGEFLSVQLDDSASKALVESGPSNERTVSLVALDASTTVSVQTLAIVKQVNLESTILSDGRFAVMVRQPPRSELRFFSKAGQLEFTVPLGEGFSALGSEPFPNSLMVSTKVASKSIVRLFDMTTGRLLRQVDGFGLPPRSLALSLNQAPPGSPGARILLGNRSLYLLPSMTEAPRQLLPRP